MKVRDLKIFVLFILFFNIVECVRIRKRNKSRAARQNHTSEIPLSQPPQLIEIIELEPVTFPTTPASNFYYEAPKSESKPIVNDEIKSLVQTLKSVMTKENSSSEKNSITTKKPSRNSYETKKVHLDAPKKIFSEKRHLLAKSIMETPRYMELDCKFGNLTD